MNFKLRFALLFTLCVAVLLLVSSLVINYLNYRERETAYNEHLKEKGLDIYNSFIQESKTENVQPGMLSDRKSGNDERVFILDANGTILKAWPDTAQLNLGNKSIKEIRKQKELTWSSPNNVQHLGILMEHTGIIIVVSGYDAAGLINSSNLRWILLGVFSGGLLLTALVAFLFVKQAFKPLTKLSLQMKQTNLHNLKQRIEVSDTIDEISDIARNFNGMLERLNGAFDFQRSFVYHASHELRTPLATMLSQTESALGKNLPIEEYVKLLNSLKEEQQEMIELTNSLLLISQYENMGYISEWPDIRVDEVLYEAVSNLQKTLPNLEVTIDFGSIPENDNEFVIKGNEALLKSAFSNLLKNAYLYSIDQKVQIILEADNKAIFIHFDNKGTQLPADEKDRIMTPFFRGGNALKTKGYGLGLSIVYRFISIHRGTITYSAVSNDSNRFTVTLDNVSVPEGDKKSQPVN